MEKDKLIANQALEIAELKHWKEANIKMKEDVYNIIYNIGGPLNDNILLFNTNQKFVFARIISALDL